MTHRMGIALASLISGLVALYLHLWKLGLTGALSCGGSRGCEYVQGSPYGWFLGVDVALIGTVGYAMLFVVALVGTMPAFEDVKWPNTLMQFMIWPAVLFTLRLKYGEFIVIKGFCKWCVVSAVAITICAFLVTLDRRRLARIHDSRSDDLLPA
ncbi:MAG TPA: vitamin K epoxide reductase family protein [Gemmatimonas sp.]|nr:vitamin K epoxide reductase family protein [Gemmatimonas sp.]